MKNKILAKLMEYCVVFLLFYLGAVCAIYTFQEKLLYFPSPDVPLSKNWRVIKTTQEDAVLGYHLGRGGKKTIVLFHGNSGSAASRVYYQNIFPASIDLVIAEYPGFGANFHQEITKENILSSARELMKNITADKDRQVIVAGESLGTGIAAEMASEFSSSKLMLFTPYSSIEDVAKTRYWWAPVGSLLKHNYNTVDAVRKYMGKTLVVLSGKDSTVPNEFGKKVFSELKPGSGQEIFVTNAGHTNWWVYMNAEQKKQFLSFL